jgi:hypothetical protein
MISMQCACNVNKQLGIWLRKEEENQENIFWDGQSQDITHVHWQTESSPENKWQYVLYAPEA